MASDPLLSNPVSPAPVRTEQTGPAQKTTAAPEAALEQQAREIFTTTMSPYCPGLLISDCPSGKASELKVSIRSELQSGRSMEEVRNELRNRYKTELDARPPGAGFGALMWIVPAVLLVIGGLLVARWIRSQVVANRGTSGSSGKISSD